MNDVAAVLGDGRWRAARRLTVRLPFTLMIGAVVLGVQLSSAGRTSHARAVRWLGTNWHTLATGQVWRLVTGVLTEDKAGLRLSILVPFVWVGIAEWHLGWRRTAVAYFVTDSLSTVSVLVVLRLASTHSLWSAQQIARFDCGSSAAIYGTLALYCASRIGPNAWLASVILVQMAVTMLLTDHRVQDIQHVVAISLSLVLGLAFRRRDRVALGTSGPDTGPPAPNAAG